MNIHYFNRKHFEFCIFSANFLMNFFRISRQIPENSDMCRFFNQICENKSTDSTRCELVRGGLTTRAKPPQGTSARTRRGRSARGGNLWECMGIPRKSMGFIGIPSKSWNPIEKCAGQRKSYRKMCGTKEIL